jgi:hypothetical protein
MIRNNIISHQHLLPFTIFFYFFVNIQKKCRISLFPNNIELGGRHGFLFLNKFRDMNNKYGTNIKIVVYIVDCLMLLKVIAQESHPE